MAVEAVVFDVGETLIDETRMWMQVAELTGVPAFTVMGVLGGLAERGEDHQRMWELLGVAQPDARWTADDWYPDAAPCIDRLRAAGYRVCAAGNTRISAEATIAEHVEVLGSSERWGVAKPEPAFFERIALAVELDPAKIAYVGDRVDYDMLPALAAGMVGVHIKRGPWGYLHAPPAGAIRIDSLDELPEALA